MTKEEVKAAILALRDKLGHVPSITEARKNGISRRQIRQHFGTYKRALLECSLESEKNKKVEIEQLFQDWCRVVRTMKKIPSMGEYELLSQYSTTPLRREFKAWANVASGMKEFAQQKGLSEECKDVLELVAAHQDFLSGRASGDVRQSGPRVIRDRPFYGRLMRPCPLLCEPINEAGVFFLFATLAYDMGFLVLRLGSAYPDCEAMRVVGPDRLQRVRIEFEHESRNFSYHGHDPRYCDIIVCWEHNWLECPLEVIELKKIVSENQKGFAIGHEG